MNPSYNSGGTSVPGVKPGTIASGPAPNNGNVPGVKPGTIASGPASAGSAMPAGGSMPTGGSMSAQPQQNRYIPPRQMNPAPVMPMSGGASRKPKKGIIIGGILIVVALVLGIAAVMLMPRGGGGTANLSESLNDVTNFMFFGQDNSDQNQSNKISEFNPETNTAEFINVASGNGLGNQQEYFDTALTKIDNLLKAVGSGNSQYQTVVSLKESTLALKYLSNMGYSGGLLSIYLKEGAEGLAKYADEIDNLEIKDLSDYTSVIDAANKMIDSATVYYQKYTAGNCIKDGVLNDECTDALFENDLEIIGLQSELTNTRVVVRNNISTLQKTIIDDLEALNKKINGVWYE